MIISADPIQLNSDPKEVFDFLIDFRNMESLMPDQIEDWKAEPQQCSFYIQGMGPMALRLGEHIKYEKISILPDSKTPFRFSLNAKLKKIENGSEAILNIDAELNPMMAMMARRPLQNLVNIMSQKLKETFS